MKPTRADLRSRSRKSALCLQPRCGSRRFLPLSRTPLPPLNSLEPCELLPTITSDWVLCEETCPHKRGRKVSWRSLLIYSPVSRSSDQLPWPGTGGVPRRIRKGPNLKETGRIPTRPRSAWPTVHQDRQQWDTRVGLKYFPGETRCKTKLHLPAQPPAWYLLPIIHSPGTSPRTVFSNSRLLREITLEEKGRQG